MNGLATDLGWSYPIHKVGAAGVPELNRQRLGRLALSFFGFCVLAKIAILIGHRVPCSAWTPAAYLWQDALVALLLGALEFATRRKPWIGWSLYSAAVLYIAINVPLTRITSSPMTWQMGRAARGALADSIKHYLTAGNIILILVLVLAGFILPFLLRACSENPVPRRSRREEAQILKGFVVDQSLLTSAPTMFEHALAAFLRRARTLAVLAGIMFLALGPVATGRIETLGLHRNALVALVGSVLPRIGAERADIDWRASPFDRSAGLRPGALTTGEIATGQRPALQSEAEADDHALVSTGATGDEALATLRGPAAGRKFVIPHFATLHGAAAGRNVVMVHLESTGARYLHPFGAKEDPMPNLSRLAENAVLFENACAVCPESIKGLFSVICSRYPAFDIPVENCERVRTPSLAEVLAERGYSTALFHSGRFVYLGMEAVIQHRGYQVLEDAGAISGNFQSSFGVDEPATVQRMLAWIDSLPRGQRFFLTYLPIAGHHPYDTPEPGPFPEREEIGRYRNALHYGDKALGDFLSSLKNRGLDTNTLFVIFGDHGEAFGQHEGNYGHTMFIHEENIHVPLLLAVPGLVQEQARVTRVASLIDIAPTTLDLLGLPAPAGYQGASLLEPEARIALFYTDYSLGLLGLRDGRWKFVQELESNRSKLFDLSLDPAETNNLAARFPERAQAYRRHVLKWSAAQKELLGRPEG